MNQSLQDLIVLTEGQPSPKETSSPPRKPKWTDTFAYIANPDRFCRENLERYGPIFKTSVFGGVTIFVGSSRANQMVLNGDNAYTEIGLPATTMAMFGEHSLFQRPDLHRKRKAAVRPAFAGQMLSGYVPRMHHIIAENLKHWDVTQPIALFPSVEVILFDVLVPLLLGLDLDAGDEALAGLPVTSKAELRRLYVDFFNGFYGLVKWRSPLTAFGRGQKARQKLIEFMGAVIQRKREAPLDPNADFLSMMLAGQAKEPEGVFNDQLIENQCLLQLWASHYEVSGLIASWMYQLGQYPDILTRVREERLKLGVPLESIGLAELRQLSYLENTIKETLRTLAPSSTANRRLTQSVVLDDMRYQKGWGLIAESRIAHIMESHFSNPSQFDPERFDRGEGKNYEFIPFGGGVHACLGAQMAMVLTQLFGCHLLSLYEYQLQGEADFVQFPLKRIKDDYTVQLKCWIGQ